MKFLFFNLLAVVAILYLVAVDGKSDGKLPDFLTSVVAKDSKIDGAELAERARKKLADFRAMVEQKPTSVEPPKNVQKKEVNTAKPAPTPKVEANAQPKPKPKSVEVTMRPIHKVDYSKTVEPKPVLSQKVQSVPVKETPKYMSRAERRRELNKLAQDMEMMFADKFTE